MLAEAATIISGSPGGGRASGGADQGLGPGEGQRKLPQDRPEDVAEQIPCGPDLDAAVETVRPFWEAGFTDIAIVQVGDEGQSAFLDQAAKPLLEKLRAAAG